MFIRYSLLFVVLTISWLARASSYRYSSDNLLLDELTKSCPDDGIPVCGMRHKNFFLFSNDCLLEEVNKDILMGQTSFKKVPLKYCMHDCKFSCPKIYQPICVQNMRTRRRELFVNQCELTNYVCKNNVEYLYISLSECQPSSKSRKQKKFLGKRSEDLKTKKRPIPCTNVFRPVCGIYMGVKSSFRNECLLNAENVKFNRDWRIVKNGICEEDYTNARQHKQKPTKSHSIKKRSYQSQYYNQYPIKHDSNANDFVVYKNQPKLTPNDLYLYMPPAFQTHFFNQNSAAYQQPISINKEYDEMVNKIITLPSSQSDIRIGGVEDEKAIPVLEEPAFEDSPINPTPISMNKINLNYIPESKFVDDINRQTIAIAVNRFMDENTKEFDFSVENVKADNGREEIQKIQKMSINIDAAINSTVAPKIISATTSRSIKMHRKQKQLKRGKITRNKVECEFGSTPICATQSDGTLRTFDTICDMMSVNVRLPNTWTKLHEGNCDNCKFNCNRDYKPVCVSKNGINYTMVNECYYNMGICMDKRSKWQKLTDGECERYTRIPDKYANLDPGFHYTSKYFVSESTTIINIDDIPDNSTSKPSNIKYRKNGKRKYNPKRAIRRRTNSNRCCSRKLYINELAQANIKCRCWSNSTPKSANKSHLHGPQTESYIMNLLKDNVKRTAIS
ncbi:uncharacterized protein ACRADG_012775 [Cochliomyia hominivorax]